MSQPKILIVEDNAVIALDMQRQLKRLGYVIAGSAASGEDAIALAIAEKPNLILMDIMLKGAMDGISAAERIRESLRIPVIFVTAYSDDKTLQRASVSEPFGYIVKPFTERELHAAIEIALYKYHMESKLRESEQWLGTILANIVDGVIVVDGNCRIVYMNRAAETLTGWKRDDARAKHIREVFVARNEDDFVDLEIPIEAVLRSGSPRDISNHVYLQTKDGRKIFIDKNAAPIRNEDGVTTHVALSFRDVSERKRAQIELARQHTLQESLLNAQSELGEGVLLIEGTKILFANEGICRMTGYSAGELCMLPAFFSLIPPDELPACKTRFEKSVREGISQEHFESAIVDREGNRIEVEIADYRSPGASEQRVVIFRDITERKHRDTLLRTSLASLAESQRIAHLGSWEHYISNTDDLNNNILVFSDEMLRLFGFERGAAPITREDIMRAIHPNDRQKVDDGVKRYLAGGPQSSEEIRIILPDGSERIVHAKLDIVRDENTGAPLMLHGTAQDITERVANDARLRISESRLAEAQRIAHIGNWVLYLTDTKHMNANSFECSDELRRLLGLDISAAFYTREDFLRNVHPDDLPWVNDAVQHYIAGGPRYSMDFRILPSGAPERIVHAEADLIHDEHTGTPIALHGIMQDITERIASEVELRASQESLAEAQRMAHVGNWEYPLSDSVNLDNNMIYCSDEMLRLFGLPLGSSPVKRDAITRVVHWEDRQKIDDAVQQCIAGRPRVSLDYRILVPGFPERTVHSEFDVIRDPATGAPVTVRGTLQDISERVAAENETRLQKLYFELLFQSLPEAAAVISHEENQPRVITNINNAFSVIFQYAPEEAIGKSVNELIIPDGYDDELRGLLDATTEGKVVEFETKRRRKDGRLVDVSHLSAPIVKNGKPFARIALFRDISERLANEAQLRASQENLAKAQRIAHVGSWELTITDPENLRNNALMCSDELLRFLGYTSAVPITVDDLINAVHPEDRSMVVEAIVRSLAGGPSLNMDIRISRQDAPERIVHIESDLIRDTRTGAPVISHGTVQDITERIAAENEIRLQKLYFESLFQHLPEAVSVIRHEKHEAVITNVNKAFTELFQYSREEAINQSSTELIVPAGNESEVRLLLDRVTEGNTVELETKRRRKDGTIFDVSLLTSPIFENGRYSGGFALYRDITDRIKAQQERLLQIAYFERLFEGLPEATLVINPDGTIQNANRGFTQLFQYTVAECIGKSVDDFIVPPGKLYQAEELSRSAMEGNIIETEDERMRKDGTNVPVSILTAPILLNGEVIGIFGIYRDITERKKADEALRLAKETAEESDRLKTNFIAIISHEVRTPLNAILGFTGIIRRTMTETLGDLVVSRYGEWFDSIDRSTKRLLKLIESILDISIVQAGTMKITMTDEPLEEHLRHAADELRLKAEEAGLQFVEDYSTSGAFIHVDATRFVQIVSNIIGNALKYTPEGSITLRSRVESDVAVVEITDTGIGIPDSVMPTIYEPFRQGSEGFRRGFQGAGLGLSVAQGFTEAMGGTIELRSLLHKGTTVILRFPVVKTPAGLRAPKKTESSVPVSAPTGEPAVVGTGRLAFIVEDNPENLMYVKFVMQRGGWELRTASTGADVLRLFDTETPDVVLMDINLAGPLSGLDVLKTLRETGKYTHVPVIAVTAYAFDSEQKHILDAGFDGYLAKPFSVEQLEDALARHVPLVRKV